jgi:DNA-binding MarR family transcriptional regulator
VRESAWGRYPRRSSLAEPGRPGVRKIAARFGVDPGTVQRIIRPFEAASVVVA